MPAAGSEREIVQYLSEILRYVKKTYSTLRSELDEIKSKLDELSQRVSRLESSLKVSRAYRTLGRESLTESAKKILEEIRRNLFIDTKSILNKRALKILVDRGKVVLLRDEMLNLEVVTTPDIVRKILSRLPKSADEVAREFTEREYELLKILNRLGYVLIRDNVYVPSELSREFLEGTRREN